MKKVSLFLFVLLCLSGLGAVVLFEEHFSGPDLPAGWNVEYTGEVGNLWRVSDSAGAGGTPYQMLLLNQHSFGTSRLTMPAIPIHGRSSVKISYKLDLSALPEADLRVQCSTNGTDWTDIWAFIYLRDGYHLGPTTLEIYANHLTGDNLYISWFTEGWHNDHVVYCFDDLLVESTDITIGYNEMPTESRVHNGNADTYQDRYIYHAGGMHVNLPTDIFLKYDTHADNWDVLPTMPVAVAASAVSVVGDEVIATGGAIMIYLWDTEEWLTVSVDSTQVYSIADNTWRMGPTLPETLRWCRSAVYADRYLYLAGGYWDNLDENDYNTVNSVYVLDCQTMLAWQVATPLPEARLGGAFACNGNTLMYTCGADSLFDMSGVTFVGEIDPTDPTIITWTQSRSVFPGWQADPTPGIAVGGASLAPIAEPNLHQANNNGTRNPALFRVNGATWSEGRFIVAGGSSNASPYWDYLDGIHVFDPLTDTWTQPSSLITAVTAAATVSTYSAEKGWKMFTLGGDGEGSNNFNPIHNVQSYSEIEFEPYPIRHDAQIIFDNPNSFPGSQMIGLTYYPQATVTNLSRNPETALVSFVAWGYSSQRTVQLAAYETLVVDFDPWTPLEEVRWYPATITLSVADDANPTDNALELVYGAYSEFWYLDANTPVATKLSGGLGYKEPGTGTEYYYMFGGWVSGQASSQVKRFEIMATSDRWSTMASMPAPRYAFASARVGNFYYVIGGIGLPPEREGLIKNTVYRYDLVNNTWETMSNLPARICDTKAVVYEDRYIYVVGGRYSSAQATVYVLDTQTDIWTNASSLPTERYAGALGIVGNCLVYIDGVDTAGNTRTEVWEGLINPQDLSLIDWTQAGDFPGGAVRFFDAAPWGVDGIIMAGGTNHPAVPAQSPGPVWCYKPETNEWLKMPDLIIPVHSACIGTIHYGGTGWNLVVLSGAEDQSAVTHCQVMDGQISGLVLSTPELQIAYSDYMLHLSWNPVDGAEAYILYRSETPDGYFEEIATIVSDTETWLGVEEAKGFFRIKAVTGLPGFRQRGEWIMGKRKR